MRKRGTERKSIEELKGGQNEKQVAAKQVIKLENEDVEKIKSVLRKCEQQIVEITIDYLFAGYFQENNQILQKIKKIYIEKVSGLIAAELKKNYVPGFQISKLVDHILNCYIHSSFTSLSALARALFIKIFKISTATFFRVYTVEDSHNYIYFRVRKFLQGAGLAKKQEKEIAMSGYKATLAMRREFLGEQFSETYLTKEDSFRTFSVVFTYAVIMFYADKFVGQHVSDNLVCRLLLAFLLFYIVEANIKLRNPCGIKKTWFAIDPEAVEEVYASVIHALRIESTDQICITPKPKRSSNKTREFEQSCDTHAVTKTQTIELPRGGWRKQYPHQTAAVSDVKAIDSDVLSTVTNEIDEKIYTIKFDGKPYYFSLALAYILQMRLPSGVCNKQHLVRLHALNPQLDKQVASANKANLILIDESKIRLDVGVLSLILPMMLDGMYVGTSGTKNKQGYLRVYRNEAEKYFNTELKDDQSAFKFKPLGRYGMYRFLFTEVQQGNLVKSDGGRLEYFLHTFCSAIKK